MFEGSDFIWFVQMFFVFLSEIPDFWVLQDIVKLPASFATTIGDQWDISWLSVAFMMRFYNNAARIFGTEGVLCRRFVNL